MIIPDDKRQQILDALESRLDGLEYADFSNRYCITMQPVDAEQDAKELLAEIEAILKGTL